MFEWLAPSAQSACHAKQSIAAKCNQPDNCSCYFSVCDLYNQAYKALALHQPWHCISHGGGPLEQLQLLHLYVTPCSNLELGIALPCSACHSSYSRSKPCHTRPCTYRTPVSLDWVSTSLMLSLQLSCMPNNSVSFNCWGCTPWKAKAGCGSAGCSSQVRLQTQLQAQGKTAQSCLQWTTTGKSCQQPQQNSVQGPMSGHVPRAVGLKALSIYFCMYMASSMPCQVLQAFCDRQDGCSFPQHHTQPGVSATQGDHPCKPTSHRQTSRLIDHSSIAASLLVGPLPGSRGLRHAIMIFATRCALASQHQQQ